MCSAEYGRNEKTRNFSPDGYPAGARWETVPALDNCGTADHDKDPPGSLTVVKLITGALITAC